MFCPNCGTQLPDGSRFCPSCGFSLTGDEPADPSHPKPPVQAPQQPSYQQVPPEPKQPRQPLNWPAFIRTMTTGDVRNLSLAGLQAALLAALCGVIFITQDAEGLPRVFDTGSSGSSAVAAVSMILFIAAIVLNFAAAVFGGIQLGRKAGYPHLIQTLCAVGVDFVALFFLIPTMQYYLNEAQVLNMGFDMNSFFQGIAMAGPETVHDLLRQINTPSVAASIVVLVLSAAAVIVVLNASLRTPADAGPADELAEKVDL